MSSAQLRAARLSPSPSPASTDAGAAGEARASDVPPQDLKRKTLRGALVSTVAQVSTFLLRTASLIVLARLLLKEDFGLVNMATAFTGFLGLIRDGGLSMATVQRSSITTMQTSTLFWVNLAVGGVLAVLSAAIAPTLAAFYGEPRLLWVTAALGTSFLFNGAAAQHRAVLQRSLRFAALAAIDTIALVSSITAGIGMALAGFGYWALVVMTVSQPVVSLLGAWLATGWIPGRPRPQSGIQSMLAFGGAVTLNNLIVYLAYNADKVLIGRFWGAEALGVYGRAYQLTNLPIESLNSTIGLVLFPALSRVQNDPARFRSYFLKAYSFFLSMVVPITVWCALFAHDIVLVLLGPNWREAAHIFRLLAPTILAFAFANPFAWLMLACGHAGRCLRIALVVTPVLILSYALGLPYGPHGVAVGFSVTMVLAVIPVLLWAKRGTLITMGDILRAVAPASTSIAVAATATLVTAPTVDLLDSELARLAVQSSVLFGLYFVSLLFIMKQKPVYVALLKDTGLWPVGGRLMNAARV